MLRIVNWDQNFVNWANRKLKRLEWVPMPVRKFSGSGYTALVMEHPNGAAHFGAWCAMVLIAANGDPRGTLPRAIGVNPHDISGICRLLAGMSRLPAAIFEEAVPRLIEIGWLEVVVESVSPSRAGGKKTAVLQPAASNR